jgi:hypothetical protein
MRNNLANKAMRNSDVGHLYVQLSAGSASPVEVKKNHLIRVRAGAAGCTISIEMPGGTPTEVYGAGTGYIPMKTAITLAANEVVLLNVGNGVPTKYIGTISGSIDETKRGTVTVSFSAAPFCVSEAQEFQPLQ